MRRMCWRVQEWQYIDSLDPEGEYGSWSYQDLEPPAKGEPGWPRLQIENRCYQSRVFRKLNIELAHRQDGLEVRTMQIMHVS